jgi:hypothetical protein
MNEKREAIIQIIGEEYIERLEEAGYLVQKVYDACDHIVGKLFYKRDVNAMIVPLHVGDFSDISDLNKVATVIFDKCPRCGFISKQVTELLSKSD